jgi:hypothetical protein
MRGRGRAALLGLLLVVIACTIWSMFISQPQTITPTDVTMAELRSEEAWAEKRAAQADEAAAKKVAEWAANKAEVDRLLAETKGKLSALEARLGEGYADCGGEGGQCECTGQVRSRRMHTHGLECRRPARWATRLSPGSVRCAAKRVKSSPRRAARRDLARVKTTRCCGFDQLQQRCVAARCAQPDGVCDWAS